MKDGYTLAWLIFYGIVIISHERVDIPCWRLQWFFLLNKNHWLTRMCMLWWWEQAEAELPHWLFDGGDHHRLSANNIGLKNESCCLGGGSVFQRIALVSRVLILLLVWCKWCLTCKMREGPREVNILLSASYLAVAAAKVICLAITFGLLWGWYACQPGNQATTTRRPYGNHLTITWRPQRPPGDHLMITWHSLDDQNVWVLPLKSLEL